MTNKIDPIFLTTTLIKGKHNDQYVLTATGFFFVKDNVVFLITNKHVIYGDNFVSDNKKPLIESIVLTLHTNSQNLSQNEDVEIPLYQDNKAVWLEHEQTNVDVIAIPIMLDRDKFIFVPISNESIDVGTIQIGFEKIFVMGYPLGWYDAKHNFPITRIGHLSSPFGVPFNDFPFMLGDVETHSGMSGSPVFMYLKDYVTEDENGNLMTNLGASKVVLIGIFSGQPVWPIRDNETGKTTNVAHSLSVVWFSELIRNIIS